MCESGKLCYAGEGCGARVNQLKRLVWVLMIWVFVLTLGLGASITFQTILRRGSDTTSPAKSTEAKSQLTSYDCFGQNDNGEPERTLLWKGKNEEKKTDKIKIKEDGNYFLFLSVTLQSPNPGVTYTVTVRKTTYTNSTTNITDGRINGTEKSNVFMGIGVPLIKNTLISVIYEPQEAKFDVRNTHMGLIKF